MSNPRMCRTATAQDGAASPSVAFIAAVLPLVVAAEREAGVASRPVPDRPAGSATMPMSSPRILRLISSHNLRMLHRLLHQSSLFLR